MALPRITVCIFLFLVALSVPASADSATYDLTASNGNISPPASSYGSISLTLNNSGGIDVVVQMTPGYTISGGGTAFALNLGTGLNLSSISINNLPPGFSLSPSGGNVSGFGFFGVRINGPSASSGLSALTFTLTTNGGFTSVGQLVALSTSKGGTPQDGYMDFAAHVIPNNSSYTGYAGANSTQVPEGSSISLLLATCLSAVGAIYLRGRKN